MTTPFDDFRQLAATAPPADAAAVEAVRARDRQLTKPPGSLGRLEALVEWLAAWQGQAPPRADRMMVALFATSHGVTEEGVSAYPAEVSAQMLANFEAGGAAINRICEAAGLGLRIFDLAVAIPSGNIAREDAFADEKACAATMAFGLEAIAGGIDVLCLGEMGIGNTTVAAAVLHALFGGEAADWAGAGTGLDAAGVARKADVLARAVARLEGEGDPLQILRRVGGREIAAMAGAILAARHQKVPVLVDGFVATAAAAVVARMADGAIDHCRFGHLSAERAHGRALAALGARPILDLDMRLGEGTGAALAANLARIAVATHTGMATFADAGVSDRDGAGDGA